MAAVLLLALALAGCASGGRAGTGADRGSGAGVASGALATGAAAAGSRCGTPRSHAPGPVTETFTFDGQRRTYLLQLPASYDGTRAVPLVLGFHGWASDMVQFEADTDLLTQGAAAGDAVVIPDALGSPRQWNMFGTAGGPDDFGFIHALVAELRTTLCIDPARTYAVGHSNGSAFVGFLACKAPYDFAAIALVSATVPSTCPAGVHPSVLAVAGTADPLVPYDGGSVSGGPVKIPSVADTFAAYRRGYHCAAGVDRSVVHPGVDQERATGCEAGARVVVDTIEGGRHLWPGSARAKSDPGNSRAGQTFATTKAVLAFFAAR